jgi:hypothetical protein
MTVLDWYFKDVLERISTHPAGKTDELLPCNWMKLKTDGDNQGGDSCETMTKVA